MTVIVRLSSNNMPNQNLPKELEEAKFDIEVIKGVEGISVYVNDYRIAGNKPWGGGTSLGKWTRSIDQLHPDIREYLLKCYESGKAAGYKDGILGAIGEVTIEGRHVIEVVAYRSELLSRLEERMKGLCH